MVWGRCTVSCGVLTWGVERPNDPMELGVNKAQLCSRDTSRALYRPLTPMFQASCGRASATAESKAARLSAFQQFAFRSRIGNISAHHMAVAIYSA